MDGRRTEGRQTASGHVGLVASVLREFPNELAVVGKNEELLCHVCAALGKTPPVDEVEDGLRDLLADVYDMLHASRVLITANYISAPSPVIRRAFEDTSLFIYLALNREAARKWLRGGQIKNEDVRRHIAKHTTIPKLAVRMRDTYEFHSHISHPNRTFVLQRHLGEGSEFTFGPREEPILPLVGTYLGELLDIWWTLIAFTSIRFIEVIRKTDPQLLRVLHAQMVEDGKALAVLGRRLQSLCASESPETPASQT